MKSVAKQQINKGGCNYGENKSKSCKAKIRVNVFSEGKAFKNIVADVFTGNSVFSGIQLCTTTGYMGCFCKIQLEMVFLEVSSWGYRTSNSWLSQVNY